MPRQIVRAGTRPPETKALRWVLIACLLCLVIVADWFAGGVGPRIVLGSATVNLTSVPDNAGVLLNGEHVGATPLRYEDVRPGAVVVRFEHRFHEAVAMRIHLARGERRDVHVEFPAAVGVLEIVSNPRGAVLAIDGQNLADAAPVVLAHYPTGAYEVSASIAHRQTKTQTVEVLPNARTEVAFELERLPAGEVFLDLSPGDAEIEIVGVDAPYHHGVRLPRGVHAFRVRRAGYATQEFKLPVRFGRNQRAVRLTRLQTRLSLAAEPADAIVEVSYDAGGGWRNIRYTGPLTVPMGLATVTARAIGFRNYSRQLTLRERSHSHTIRMSPFNVQPGRRFRDALKSGGTGPDLVIIEAGVFQMGSLTGSADERPVHQVTITQPFAISVFEVTHGEYDRFRGVDVAALKNPVEGRPALPVPADVLARHPVTDLTWPDTEEYVVWLSRETGYRYRLPSEAEWEYVARAGSTTRYPFGDDPDDACTYANIADQTLADNYRKYSTVACNDGALGIAPVGGFRANDFGVHDMLGNAEEWVADCWRGNYSGSDGTSRPANGYCTARAVRGGAWDSAPEDATPSFRSFSTDANRARGFRVVREL